MSVDRKAFGISDSLVNAVTEALKGGQVKLDKNHNGKIDGQDFKMLRKEEVVDEGNPMNKEKKNAAVSAVGAKNKDSQYLTRINPSVADKIRGREKMSGNDRKQHEEVEQVDELSTDTYHSAAHKAAKRAMGDAQGRSGPIFKKYAGMANKFRDKGMSQEKKEKAMKEETLDEGIQTTKRPELVGKDSKQHHNDLKKSGYVSKGNNANYKNPEGTEHSYYHAKSNTMHAFRAKSGKINHAFEWNPNHSYAKAHGGNVKEETDPGFVAEADNAVAKQIAAKKDTFKKQLQQKIAAKQMNTMQAKANKRLSNIHASNDKCTCQEGKGKSKTCEMHGEKDKAMKGGKEQIIVNPPMREAAELPKKVITKGHEIAKSLIKHRAGVDNPYAVGMAQAKKSAKMNDYRTDRDKNKED